MMTRTEKTIIRLWNDGYSSDDIAEHFGIMGTQVRAILDRFQDDLEIDPDEFDWELDEDPNDFEENSMWS